MTIRGFLNVAFLCKRYISFNSSFVKFNMYYLILSSSTCQTSFCIIFRAYYCFIVVEEVVEKHKKRTEPNLKIWLCAYGCGDWTTQPKYHIFRAFVKLSVAWSMLVADFEYKLEYLTILLYNNTNLIGGWYYVNWQSY